MAKTREAVVNLARSWIGKKESDGSHKSIIDEYNSTGPFPRNIKMQYNWAWCACTWSALAKKLGYTDIMPIEISCGYLIEAAKKMGIWVENDAYVPSPGDAVLYSWGDKGSGDNTLWPDHVGTVETVNKDAGYFVVIEGNYSDSVKRRTVSINGKYIRGFITPKYDNDVQSVYVPNLPKDIDRTAHEVIAGQWGNGSARKDALEKAGYDYSEVQARVCEILNGSAVTAKEPIQDQSQPVDKIVSATCNAMKKDEHLYSGHFHTTANLYCRNDAGSNKKALCLIPNGTKVRCWGYYTPFNGVDWLLIEFVMDGVSYTGFSSSKYLTKI